MHLNNFKSSRFDDVISYQVRSDVESVHQSWPDSQLITHREIGSLINKSRGFDIPEDQKSIKVSSV